MHIYIQSAGVQGKGYHWQHCELPSAPDNQIPPIDIENWHRGLCEEDAIFALSAGYSQDGWSVEFRNLRLKGISDFRGREIILTIIFSQLASEKEVRALALAYLDLELQSEVSNVSGKIKYRGRYCPELCDAYRGTADGNYQYDFNAAKQWAENAIAQYSPMLQNTAPNHKWEGQINPSDDKALECLKQQIKTYSLQNRRGLSILWAQVYANTKLAADSVLTYTREKSSYLQSPTPHDEEKSPVQQLALKLFEEAKKHEYIPAQHFRNQRFVIIGALTLVLISIIIALCTGEKKEEGPVEPHLTQPAPTPPTPKGLASPIIDTPNGGHSTKGAPLGQGKSKNPSSASGSSPIEQQTPATSNTVVKPNKIGNQAPVKKTPTETELPGTHPYPERFIP